MPGDGILSIGATIDKTGVDEGAAGVQKSVQSLEVEVTQAGQRIQKAWQAIPATVKASAGEITQSQLATAEGAMRVKDAFRVQANAMKVAADASLPYAERMSLLAASQENLARAQAAAAETIETSSFGIREALSGVQEKFAEVAAEGRLSAEGIAGGFAGLGTLFGAGIMAGFAGHFLDETAKVNVELGHLSDKTRLAVTDLAGLREMVKEMGVDWEPITTALIRMERALSDSNEPSKQLKAALGGVGLQMSQIKGLAFDQQLNIVSAAVKENGTAGEKLNAVLSAGGRGAAVLVPLMNRYGGTLVEVMKAQGQLTGVTEKSVSASEEWTANVAKLAEQFQRFGNFVFEWGSKIVGFFQKVDAAIVATATIFPSVFSATESALGTLGLVMADVAGGNIKKAFADIAGGAEQMKAVVANAFSEIKAAVDLVGPHAESQMPGAPDEDQSGAGASGGASGGGSAQAGYNPLVSNMSRIQGGAAAVARQQADLGDTATAAAQKTANAWGQSAVPIFASTLPKAILHTQSAFQQMAQQMTQIMQQAFQKLAQGFNQTVAKWIIDGGHFRQMMQQQINQVAAHFVQQTMQMTEQWAKAQIMKVVRHQVAQAQITATDAAGAAQGVAIQKGADSQTNLAAAKTAAKNTYKVVSGWPVVGPILAPPLAAAAFAAVEAFDAGGVVGNRMGLGGMGAHVPVLAEAGERVLTQKQTENFDRMVNQSSDNSRSAEFHYHDNSSWSGVDGASVEGMYRSNARAGRREFMRQMRLANAI